MFSFFSSENHQKSTKVTFLSGVQFWCSIEQLNTIEHCAFFKISLPRCPLSTLPPCHFEVREIFSRRLACQFEKISPNVEMTGCVFLIFSQKLQRLFAQLVQIGWELLLQIWVTGTKNMVGVR